MAKTVENFTPTSATESSRARYPYDQWLDGQIWQLERGEDFGEEGSEKPKVNSVVSVIRGEAHKRGLGLKAQMIDDDTVQVQATEKRERKPKDETEAEAAEARAQENDDVDLELPEDEEDL